MTTDTTSVDYATTIPGTGRPKSAEAAAFLRAAEEFLRTHDQSVLIPLLGSSDGFMSLEELMEMRVASLANHR